MNDDTKSQAEFVPDFLFLRSSGPNGESRGGFRWPTEAGAMVVAPDWNPEPVCGHGLHGLAYGLGDWALMRSPGDPAALWLVCEAILSERVDLGDKIKVPRCRVVYVGTFGGAMECITPAQSEEVIRRSRGSASATGYSGSASATGDRGSASATGVHSVALGGGFDSRAMAGEGCLLVLVERDAKTGAILHHFAGMVGAKRKAKPGVWYTLRGGKLIEVEP